MDVWAAEFVRYIARDESLADLVNEAKGDTWTKGKEHAALLLDDGRLAMVRGGRDGIELVLAADGRIHVETPDGQQRVRRLAWHTHPRPTGPSDHDCDLLRRLGQDMSVVYELGAGDGGTVFRPKATEG